MWKNLIARCSLALILVRCCELSRSLLHLIPTGFSKTTPTIVFKPSQVIRRPDIYADGSPEATEFDDPNSQWTSLPASRDLSKVSMNDGCARISLGACRLIRKKLSITGPMPSCYQARIGGAKGVWSISAESDSKSEEDNDVWIEITESQEKFGPHQEDLKDDSFNEQRLTFEVVRQTQPPSPSFLYLSFLPILANRGVKEEDMKRLIFRSLSRESSKVLNAIKDRISCRRWIYENNTTTEERLRTDGLLWQAGLPLSNIEKIIQLLEWGFVPAELDYLGILIQEVVEIHFTKLAKSLKIRLSRSTMVMGIADPTGTLKPGEIQLVFSNSFIDEESGEFYTSLNGKDVIVARHPALRNSDAQKVRSCTKLALAHLVDVVVFPSTGCIPLASKLQGGDYDGDTFWLCWEDTLVKDFRNAPAPIILPEPESFGIEVDRKTLGDVLRGPDPMTTFLTKSFRFRCQPDFLGRCTNLIGNLAYLQNSIDSTGVQYAIDFHDLIIDTAKNGYKVTENSYQTFLGSIPGRSKKAKLATPAYKDAINAGFKGAIAKTLSGNITKDQRKWNTQHIVDALYFNVIEPEILKTFKQVGEFFASSEKQVDEALRKPYLEMRERGDGYVQAELDKLEEELEKVRALWNDHYHGQAASKGRNAPDVGILEVFQLYCSILPKTASHPDIARWTVHRFLSEPNTWSILKASSFYYLFGKKKNKMVFRMAGRELGYIKALGRRNIRQIDEASWAQYKPGKPKEVGVSISLSSQAISPLGNKDDSGGLTGSDDDEENDSYTTQIAWEEVIERDGC
jgi:hypothetical protein